MKNIIAITLAAVSILSVGAAEATPVTNGFVRSTTDSQNGAFSGANFAVSNLNVGPHYVEVSGERDSGSFQDDPLFGSDATLSRTATW